jgi:uncharacterized protein (DUF1800 family)
MKHREASIALRRFGLGPRPGDVRQVSADPRGYVLAALSDKAAAAAIGEPAPPPSHLSFQAMRAAQQVQRQARQQSSEERRGQRDAADAENGPNAKGTGPGALSPRSAGGKNGERARDDKAGPMAGASRETGKRDVTSQRPGEIQREVFRLEVAYRTAMAVQSQTPFVERLVYFWSNHFSVSAVQGQMVRVLAGSFEREAIRPHVLGRFVDMLKAVEQHPAMLIYLDNARSIGPSSPAGRNRGRGLNENLAREILELHTLGVGGGYAQADVSSLAMVLTGWTVADAQLVANAAANPKLATRLGGDDVVAGRFVFVPNRHEPGQRIVLGKRYENRGLATGEAVLGDLARHPATARHIAGKLARHFVSDTPPPELVGRLEKAFLASDGDLMEVARVLAMAPDCWATDACKVVPPFDFVVSQMRGFDFSLRPAEVMRIAGAIGQPMWGPPSPKGWPEDDDAWMGPSAVRERLRIAEQLARLVEPAADPREVAAELMGAAMSVQTRQAIERAETREQGLQLLMMSPEVLRR